MSRTAEMDPRQSELLELQKKYRTMELNRRQYAEESQALLRKQQVTIDKLRKDNDGIKSDIAMIMRSSNRPMGASEQEKLQKLHDTGDKYANHIDFERKNIETMEEQIAIMKQKLLHQRRAMGGVNASKDNYYMIQKQIRILENRLEKALVKFNEAIAHNKTLRDKIDDLRRERVVFESIYRKMEKELREKKQKMAEIIELSNQSYEQRDNYQMEVAAIEQSNRKEQEDFEDQMLELGRMLENELKLPAPGAGRGAGGGSQTKSSMKESMGGTWGNTGEMSADNSQERVQNFEEAFMKIKQATGISDVDSLVRTFIKNEDHNFSLFNYVNEQNNEIEKYEEQIQALRDEEQRFAQETGDDAHQHKQIVKELEEKLASTESMSEKYEVRCQDLQRVVESLKRGIQGVFEKLDVPMAEDEETEAASAQLQESAVSETNMVHFLGIVEQKSNKLLQVYADVKKAMAAMKEAQQKKKDADLAKAELNALESVMGAGPKVQRGQDLLAVNPPKCDEYQSEDEEDEDEDETRPLTRDELKVRTLNRLQRRGGAGKKKNKKMNATR
jgi:coiled-coil domain-containing protein 63/114